MDLVRDIALMAGGLLVVAGLALAVVLELGSRERRLVGRARDTIEVMLPPILTTVLLGVVWSSFGFG